MQVPILYNLSDRQLWQLARAMIGQTFSKGDVVFRKNDVADTFYIIQQGVFTVFDGASLLSSHLGFTATAKCLAVCLQVLGFSS